MDGISFSQVVTLASNLGVPGLVLVIWYFSDKSHERTLKQYREDMIEQRQMYRDNVELVKAYREIACSLRDLIVLNTQTMTRLCDKVDGNQFCPQVRLKKAAEGRQE